MKKSKVNFLENFSTNPELAKKVLTQGGISWAEIKERPSDFYDASSGSVPGMIYYADTVKFAKKNAALINSALWEFESECGTLTKPTDDETQILNWMAWFAWENTMGEVMNFLEQ